MLTITFTDFAEHKIFFHSKNMTHSKIMGMVLFKIKLSFQIGEDLLRQGKNDLTFEFILQKKGNSLQAIAGKISNIKTLNMAVMIFFRHNVFWAQLNLTSVFNDKIGKLVKKYREEEGKRLDGEVEERVRAVLRIADKNEDDKIVFQEFEDLMKDKAKRDFIDRALDLNKVRGWSYDTPWLKEEWEKEKK